MIWVQQVFAGGLLASVFVPSDNIWAVSFYFSFQAAKLIYLWVCFTTALAKRQQAEKWVEGCVKKVILQPLVQFCANFFLRKVTSVLWGKTMCISGLVHFFWLSWKLTRTLAPFGSVATIVSIWRFAQAQAQRFPPRMSCSHELASEYSFMLRTIKTAQCGWIYSSVLLFDGRPLLFIRL